MNDQNIGNYRVLRQIGAGGMARVYLAVHQDVPSLKVILKVLTDPRLGERFKGEADKLAFLDGHPNICQIKHFFHHGEDTVIVMEYIDGVSVQDRIDSKGRLPLDESLQIITDVLDILSFAHRKGIYHRDVKPSNIMLDKKGHVKIIDFGIAKGETDPNLTVAGAACGTPAYMAPEQFTPTPETNYTLIDVYAAGGTLFTMLTGQCAYQGDNEFAIRDAKLFSDVPQPRSFNPDIPKEVEEVVMTAMAREPDERYQTAERMRAALDEVRRRSSGHAGPGRDGLTMEVDGGPAPPSPPPPQPGPAPKRRRWLTRGVAAILVLMIAAVTVYLLFFGGTELGTITVLVAPEGDVYINDKPVGGDTSAVTYAAAAGTYVVQVYNVESVEGSLVREVTLQEGSADTISFVFTFSSPTGTIEITALPVGDIYIDDSLLGKGVSNASLECDTGRHMVRIENARSIQKRFEETLSVGMNEVVPRTFRFSFPLPTDDEREPTPEPAHGWVRVGSRPPGALVYIDGVQQEHRTIYQFKLEPGAHSIRVELEYEGQLVTDDTTIQVKGDSIHKVSFDLTGDN